LQLEMQLATLLQTYSKVLQHKHVMLI